MSKSAYQTFEVEQHPLGDGSICEIAWQRRPGDRDDAPKKTYLASRVADGITVWGQIFSSDPSVTDVEADAAELVERMKLDPAAFDRRRNWCVKCGAGSNNPCEHGAPYTA